MSTLKQTGFLALYVTTTGDTAKDRILALGYAHGTRTKVQSSGKIILSLGKPEHMTWDEFFHIHNYDARTYNEVWSQNVDVLNQLQSCPDTDQDSALAGCVNRLLHVMEQTYKNWTVLLDTTIYDSMWLNNLLIENGHIGLSYYRNEEVHPNAVCHTSSYYCGLVGVPIHREDHKRVQDFFSRFKEEDYNDYDPALFARNILKRYQYACTQWKKRESLHSRSRVQRKKQHSS